MPECLSSVAHAAEMSPAVSEQSCIIWECSPPVSQHVPTVRRSRCHDLIFSVRPLGGPVSWVFLQEDVPALGGLDAEQALALRATPSGAAGRSCCFGPKGGGVVTWRVIHSS